MTPEGWTETRFGNAFTKRAERGKAGLPTMSVTINDGLVFRDSIDRKMDTNLLAEEHLLVRKGDIAYNMMRMWQGASGLAEADALVSPAYVVLRPTPAIDPLFAAYLFKHPRTIYLFWAYSHGLTEDRLRLYFDDFSLIPICLPPISEQRKIAEILSTWDRSIETVEALIDNARAQKQALMQQLLPHGSNCPQRRVGSSYKEWQETMLGHLGDTFGGLTGKSKADFGYGFPFVTYKNVFENAVVDPDNFELVKIGSGERQHSVKFGDILFTTSSETPEEVGMSSVVMFDTPTVYLNSFCFGFRAHSAGAIEPAFSSHYFRSEDMRTKIATLAQGSTRYNISKAGLLKLKFFLPEPAEQREIANILDVAQNEIARLTRQLTALRIEKSALMQQLLTGKRRVTVEKRETA